MKSEITGITRANEGMQGISWNILGQTYVPKNCTDHCFSWHATLPPGTFVLVDQFVDRTHKRESSFFGKGCVAHVSMAHPISPLLQGIVFGSAVWFVSYMGWVPALGLMPPPHRDRPGRQLVMVLAHWIYGATLGAVVQVFGRQC